MLHIDPSGAADPIPFGVDTGPYIVVRVRPMRDGLSLYSISSCDASDEGEEDIIHTSTVASRIVTTSKCIFGGSLVYVNRSLIGQYINAAYLNSALEIIHGQPRQRQVRAAGLLNSISTPYLAIFLGPRVPTLCPAVALVAQIISGVTEMGVEVENAVVRIVVRRPL